MTEPRRAGVGVEGMGECQARHHAPERPESRDETSTVAPPTVAATSAPPTAGPRCPYCHGGIPLESRAWLACERCLARHHRGCWVDARRCATCGEGRAIGPRRGRDDRPRPRRRLLWAMLALAALALAAAPTAIISSNFGDLAQEHHRLQLRAEALEQRVAHERAVAARSRCALALHQHGHPDLAAPLVAWDGHDAPAAHALRNRMGWFLLGLQREKDPARRSLRAVLEAELPDALGER